MNFQTRSIVWMGIAVLAILVLGHNGFACQVRRSAESCAGDLLGPDTAKGAR